jgi:hypothetical protein
VRREAPETAAARAAAGAEVAGLEVASAEAEGLGEAPAVGAVTPRRSR